MKKIIRYCLPFFSLFLLSCGNAINSAGDEKDTLAQNAAMASLSQPVSDTATYRYLGYMYDEASGKDLNDSVFTGEVFERYEVQIQNAVNLMLRFPTRMLENVEGMTGEDAEGMAYTDWWRTLPDQVKSELNRLGKKPAEGMTEALKNSYSSGAEDEAIDYYMNGIDPDSDSLPAKLRENITTALTRTNTIRGGELINEVCDSICAFNLMQNGFLLQHYVYNDEGRIQLVDAKLNFIHNRLSSVENRLLSNASSFSSFQELMSDVDFKDLYQDMYDARVYMDGFYSQLMLYDHRERHSCFREMIYVNEYSINNVTRSALDTNKEKAIKNRYSEIPIPFIRIVYHSPGTIMIPTINIEALTIHHPSFFIKMKLNCDYNQLDLDDILALKRTSLTQIDSVRYFYSGDDILHHRKNTASIYYNTIVIPLVRAVNRGPGLIIQEIKEIKYKPVPVWQYINNGFHYEIWNENSVIFDNLSEASARYQAGCIINDIIFNHMNLYNDYLIACAAELASWAIILKAHIAAAEGL